MTQQKNRSDGTSKINELPKRGSFLSEQTKPRRDSLVESPKMARPLPSAPVSPRSVRPGRASVPGLASASLALIGCVGALAAVGCGKSSSTGEASTTSSTSTTATSAMPVASASAKPEQMGTVKMTAKSVKATFLIDAPLEKIKGVSDEGEGEVALTPDDLGKTTGTLKIKLSSLRTETFGDKGKDESQTEHARAWMEVGKETAADARAKYEYAVFKLTSVKAEPKNLAEVKEDNGVRKLTVTVSGDLLLHGVTVKREIPLVATFRGPADKPTEVTFTTEKPFTVSLQEHDIKPRDSVGKFLDGALGKIGKKIDDKVQLSLEAKLAPLAPRHGERVLQRDPTGAVRPGGSRAKLSTTAARHASR